MNTDLRCQCTSSLSSLCREATHEEKGSWPSRVEKPIGSYPVGWSDGVHDADGHGLRAKLEDHSGEDILSGELGALMVHEGGEWACDDVSNAVLNPKLVREARELEMAYFDDMKVYDRVDRSVQQACGGKLIKTRWIDVNKGDASKPNYRSRFVGKEFKTYADDSLYASTPPLEALRLIVSRAATTDKKRHLMINDVRRAYFYAEATRDLFIELPNEDAEYGKGDLVGKLRLCLYGTRDAALNWQETLSNHLIDNGFIRGVGFPSVFYNPE